MDASGKAMGGWERILWVAAAVAGLCAGLASAQPAPDPIVDRQWSRFVGVRKLQPAQHPQHRGALTAWNTADSVYLLPFDYSMCLIMCGDCGFLGTKPHAFALPFRFRYRKPAPFAVVKQEGARIMSDNIPVRATLIFALPDRELFKLKVAWNGAGVVTQETWDTETLLQPPVPKLNVPRVAFAAADFGSESDSGMVVLGDDGYGRRVDWTATGKSETVLDLIDEDFTARGGRFVGTADGDIYAFGVFPRLDFEGEPFKAPVDAVDSSGAVSGDDFAYRKGGFWLTDPATDGLRPRSWNTEWDGDGLFARIWSGPGVAPATVRLKDSPTTFRSLAPADVFAALNHAPYSYQMKKGPLAIEGVLVDIDGNYDAPKILRIRGMDTTVMTGQMRKTVPGWGIGQWPARDFGCAFTGVCLQGADVPIAIRFGTDSLRVTLPAVQGGMDMACPNQPYFRGTKLDAYRMAVDIRAGDRFVMDFGMDGLEVVVHESSALAPYRSLARSRLTGAPDFDVAGRDLAVRPGGNPVKGISQATPRFRR